MCIRDRLASDQRLLGVGVWEADSLDYSDTEEKRAYVRDMWNALPDHHWWWCTVSSSVIWYWCDCHSFSLSVIIMVAVLVITSNKILMNHGLLHDDMIMVMMMMMMMFNHTTTSNAILIKSAIFPQYTFITNGQTNWQSKHGTQPVRIGHLC